LEQLIDARNSMSLPGLISRQLAKSLPLFAFFAAHFL